ncbi:MAG: UDP-N-acetylmuramoyl-L-alanyl-D-glutamate--2,6-diaminopimelate ligase [Gemmatimonadales bacterium]|nr:UDP-N-acetylmuramoyl-L-alanyl-D-glutamate--2,6-diaminopimelate ligase [Gemmatimonadales bacterium]
MTLQSLVAVLRQYDLLVTAPTDDPAVGGVAVDSRRVTPGTLFIAERGSDADGHAYVAAAVAAGASALVVEHPMGSAAPEIVVTDGRAAARRLAEAWYHHPADALRIVAVTGTNGKTTTTALVRHLLNAEGTAGSIGTLGAFDGSGRAVSSTAGTLTTPGSVDMQATLRAMVDAGVRHVAMEASSHALDQGRLDAITFAGAIFTNLTREHLDYHHTMEAYLAAKLRLADLVAPDGVLAINADDPAWSTLHGDRRAVRWGYGADADLRIEELVALTAGSRFTLTGRFGTAEVAIPLPGEFNVANAVGAAAVMLGLGMPMAEVVARLGESPQIPGRMERIIDAPFHVIRDYAHTPDAYERVLATIRPLTPGRIIVVFGCGGDRDGGKRPIMGEIAARLADHVILTSDNPRTEDPDRIIDDIAAGMPKGSYERELDRYIAIAMATGQARPGDVVLLLGKGHETYQVIGHEKEPFDERAIVLGLLGR